MNNNITLRQFYGVWYKMNKVAMNLTPAPFHKDIVEFLEDHENWKNGTGVLQVFRNGAKSTIVSLFITYLLIQDPRRTILVQSADDRTAHKIISGVQSLIKHHPLALHLQQDVKEWRKGSFFVNGAVDPQNASVVGFGIRSNITGRRANWIIYDDVEAKNNVNTEDKRIEIRSRIAEGMNIMHENGKRLFVGTPHNYDTIYSDIIKTGASSLTIPMLKNAKGKWPNMEGECVWPERFNEAEVKRKQEAVPEHEWMSQNMLVPWNMQETILDPNNIKVYDDELDFKIANGEGVLELGGIRLLSASTYWDVSSGRRGSDRSILAIVFTDSEGHYYIHRTYQLHGNIEVQTEQIKKYAEENFLPSITVETNGVGVHAVHMLRKALKGTGIAVLEAHQSENKGSRIIKAYQASLSGGYIHAHKSVFYSPFRVEMRDFAITNINKKDDYIDASASAILQQPIRINANGMRRAVRKLTWGNSGMVAQSGRYDPFSHKTL